MSTAEQLYDHLKNEAEVLGRRMTRVEWITRAQQFLDSLKPKGEKKAKGPNISKMSDDAFDAYLVKEFTWLDVPKERAACRVWTMINKDTEPTRKRVVAWLIRAGGKAPGTTSPKKGSGEIDVYTEPDDWRAALNYLHPGLDFSGKKWDDVKISYGREIIKFLRKR